MKYQTYQTHLQKEPHKCNYMNNVLEEFLEHKSEGSEHYLEMVDEMIGSGMYSYAEQTLVGIYEFIEEHGYITENQKHTINNIKNKPSRYGRQNY